MQQVRLRSGDSFTMNFVIREDGVPTKLHKNEDIAVGFYSECGYKYIAKFSSGDIQKGDKDGYYTVSIPNTISKHFIDNVDVEIVIYDSLNKQTSHAQKVLNMNFQPRRINCEI